MTDLYAVENLDADIPAYIAMVREAEDWVKVAKMAALELRRDVLLAQAATSCGVSDDHPWSLRYLERVGGELACPAHRRLAACEQEIARIIYE